MNKYISIVIFLSTIFLIIFLRLHYIEEPFERDLTIYAYIAHHMLGGELLYTSIWDHKPPGVYGIYALAELIWGYGPSSVVYIGIIFTIISHFFLFLFLKKISSVNVALAGSIFWALASNSILMEANLPNVEVFINTFTLMAVWYFTKYLDKNTYFYLLFSGFYFALGSIFKTIIFFPFASLVLYLFFQSMQTDRKHRVKNIFKRLFVFSLPGAMVWITVFFYFGLLGRLDDMFEAIFFTNYYYSGGVIHQNIFRFFYTPSLFFHYSFQDILLLIILSIAWFFFSRREYGPLRRSFFMFFLFGLWMEVASAGKFYPHYYQVLIPVYCILAALFLSDFSIYLKRKGVATRMTIILLLFSFSAGHLFYYQLIYLKMDVNEVSKKKYGPIFVQSYQLGKYVRSKTNRCERIFVWGSEPGVYYYSNRDSASNIFYVPHLKYGTQNTLIKNAIKLFTHLKYTPPSLIIRNNEYDILYNTRLSSFLRKNYNLVTIKYNVFEIWEYKFRKKWENC